MIKLRQPQKSAKKIEQFEEFLNELAEDSSCDEIIVKRGGKEVDVGMINIYKDTDIINNFPTLWTDWKNRLNSRVVIFGQDWGPIEAIMATVRRFKNWKNDNSRLEDSLPEEELWKAFVRSENDRTTNNLINYLKRSAEIEGVSLSENFMDDIYVSMAVMFARRGNKFRGNNNFAPRIALKNNIKHMKRQIEIVQPELVITLGSLALEGISEISDLDFSGSLTDFINHLQKESDGILETTDGTHKFKLIPLFHPASHVHPNEQLKGYKFIWRNL